MYNFLILIFFPNKKKYYRVLLDTCTCTVKIPLSVCLLQNFTKPKSNFPLPPLCAFSH